MNTIFVPNDPSSPQGNDDPNVIYIAVGMAIHAWEQLELALARLYLQFANMADTSFTLADFGAKHRNFSNRMAAIRQVATAYFINHCDQDREGRFVELMDEIDDLAILRHRIAHGHLTPLALIDRPTALGSVDLAANNLSLKFRWGTPFYSTQSLRSSPFGSTAAEIDKSRLLFDVTRIEIESFARDLPLQPSL
jgi:hypothetical protein